MTVPIHSFRVFRHSTLSLILLAALAGIAGCANDQSSGGMSNPPDWVVVPSGGRHAQSAVHTYIANDGSVSCIECHGADLTGGTSKVSCFGNPSDCHHGPVAPGWVAALPAAQNHGLSAKEAPGSPGFASCQICHGDGFAGGGSQVSCFPCHGVDAPHPARPWLGPAYTHINTNTENAPVCAQCHFPGSPHNPANHPATPAAAGTAPGCLNGTLCHGATGPGGVGHSVPFPGAPHSTTDPASFATGCSRCHAITGVSPDPVAPLCTVCHRAASPLTSLHCTSCHGDPPSGATYPDVAGKHAVHGALPGVGVCNPCHNGLDAGSLAHYNRANARPGNEASRVPPGDIAFPAAYNAKSGPAAFNAANRTCSNVICHGGQATPDWQTATANAIDVPNACPNCHGSGTTQYNGYSRKHDRHIGVFGLSATTCKGCHDETKVNVSGHFQNLVTPAYEQPALATILPAVQYNGHTCNPQEGGLTGCHGQERW